MKQRLFGAIICLLFYTFPAAYSFGADAENAELRGRVIDIMTRPVAGAEVYLYDSGQVKRPADFISQKTKADGAYRLKVPAGKYWAVAILRQAGPSFGPLQVGDKHSGEPLVVDLKKTEEIDFTVMDLRDAARHSRKRSEELFEMRGRILAADETPAAMAYVLADSSSTPGNGIPRYLSAWTAADGRYTIFLPPGRFYLGAATVMPPPPGVELSRVIEVAEDMQGVDIVLPEPEE